ncbi:lipid asymmetry maintenance protein MlaB [Limnohabitans sp. Rim47]|jgi:phospholipid transport system transporter-binding protein|uniref:STAS domain-containing protein n=1 Tax=Limnohabitans sp. Rim47 TaxID=1100721 RepID=UPI0002F5A724|nr:STAS domain-containing protein [Limnohabitans sp. Rim47]
MISALTLPQTLLHDQADACLAEWVARLPLDAKPDVEVDASELVAFDSSVLAVLLGLRRVVLAHDGSLQIRGMTSRLRELASLYGVLDLLVQV